MSPALLEGLSERQVYPYHNANKSSVFALAIIILELAVLESCRPCYDMKAFQVDNSLLEEKLAQVGRKYSLVLEDLLRKMLSKSEQTRPEAAKLFEEIEKLVTTKRISIAMNIDPGFSLGKEDAEV